MRKFITLTQILPCFFIGGIVGGIISKRVGLIILCVILLIVDIIVGITLQYFFEKGIDFSSSKDEYIGEPQISSEGITIKKDEEFSKHFIGKQMATEIADKNHTEYITSKNKRKIGIDFFKKIYEKKN